MSSGTPWACSIPWSPRPCPLPPLAATTKARPLAADDIAGISLLYPHRVDAASTGSITGPGSAQRQSGINMASVVALSLNGTAIGTLTNPDGSYRIDGIPPGDYYVYTQPLPPAQQDEGTPAAIVPPSDSLGGNFAAFTGFAGQFFPHTRDWQQATTYHRDRRNQCRRTSILTWRRVPAPVFTDLNSWLIWARPARNLRSRAVAGFRLPGWMVLIAPERYVPNTWQVTPG